MSVFPCHLEPSQRAESSLTAFNEGKSTYLWETPAIAHEWTFLQFPEGAYRVTLTSPFNLLRPGPSPQSRYMAGGEMRLDLPFAGILGFLPVRTTRLRVCRCDVQTGRPEAGLALPRPVPPEDLELAWGIE